MFSRFSTTTAEQLHSRTAFCRVPTIAEHHSMTSLASQIFVFCLLNHLIQKFCFSRRGQWGCYKKYFNWRWDFSKRGGELQKNLSRRGGCLKRMEGFRGRWGPQRKYGSKIMVRYQPISCHWSLFIQPENIRRPLVIRYFQGA